MGSETDVMYRVPWDPTGLEVGREAWFTPDGRDLRQIGSPPKRDQHGLLVFDVLGDVRAGNAPEVVLNQPPRHTI